MLPSPPNNTALPSGSSALRGRALDAALLRAMWPLSIPSGSKDARGSAFVVAGAPQMPGAAALCATAVLRAGAGKLQIGTCRSVAMHVALAVPESLTLAFDETPSGAIAASAAREIAGHANGGDAFVLGPGLMDEIASSALAVAVARALDVPAVLDAAALACFTEHADAVAHLSGRAVLTPHAGEMACMLSCGRDDVEGDPVSHALHAAKRFNAVIVMKGATSYVADPSGALHRNDDGHPGLATSGSGDVLAGVIGGLLARGVPALGAACWGVYLHAQAGAVLGRRMGVGFLARELSAEVPALMRYANA